MQTIPENLQPPLIAHLETFLTPERKARMDIVLPQRTRYITLILENIYQPHNASAVVRSCECFGIQDVHIIENSYRFERTRGVSMGSDKWLTLNRYNELDDNTPSCFEALKANGYHIAAMTLSPGARPLSELSLEQPVALAFGTEISGLSETAHTLADSFVYLPMRGFTQSFNISVSAALALSELRERLEISPYHWRLSAAEQNTLKLTWLCRSIRSSETIIEEWLAASTKTS